MNMNKTMTPGTPGTPRKKSAAPVTAPAAPTTAAGEERARAIFNQIVDLYLATGSPVGSKTLADGLGGALSPASVRSIMARLESAGLLFRPHVSAGRLPTETGLRLFVDGLLEVGGKIPDGQRARIDLLCNASGTSFPDALDETTRALSGLARSASVVISPKYDEEIRHVEFVWLGKEAGGNRAGNIRALVVIVTATGQVENRIINLAPGITQDHLTEAGNLMSTLLAGVTLNEAARKLINDIEHRRREVSELASKVVESGLAILGGHVHEGGDGGSNSPFFPPPPMIVHGTSHLLDDVAATEDIEKIRNLLALLEARENTMSVLEAVQDGSGVQIFIGAENALFRHTDCAMILAPYRDTSEKIIGAVGVIGPTRMNYSAIIPLVNYTGEAISKMLK